MDVSDELLKQIRGTVSRIEEQAIDARFSMKLASYLNALQLAVLLFILAAVVGR
jgi:hypothetical protein